MSSSNGPEKSFTSHAKLIGGLTFISRLLGMARESVAAAAFGASPVWAAYTVAFTVPNLFRKLFGEGALSAAFIPLYAQAIKRERSPQAAVSSPPNGDGGVLDYQAPQSLSSSEFALASVNLLCMILLALTVVGELILGVLYLALTRPDYLLAIKLSAIMLPYVLLVCGAAFLGAILQVHGRFLAVGLTSIVLNAVTICSIVLARKLYLLGTPAGQTQGVHLLAVSVLVSGVVQIMVLAPSLYAVGFRFRPVFYVFTAEVKNMLRLSVPVALSAGLLQIGVLLDKGISFFLAQAPGVTHFKLLGQSIPYPMAAGAAARLNWAQFMSQFALGVFAIAIATAIFPKLAGEAMDTDRTKFREVLRKGIVASLFIGLPASIGMIAVADPAVRLLFQRGNFTDSDARWTILSTCIYSAAIWAYSLQSILSRAYYALHDTKTPLVWGAWNLGLNLLIEIPLLWTPLGESGMAVGTLVSFGVQSIMMTFALSRRVGGIGLKQERKPLIVMTIASLLMGLACWATMHLPFFPHGTSKFSLAAQLGMLMLVGAITYGVLCHLGGIEVLSMLKRRRRA